MRREDNLPWRIGVECVNQVVEVDAAYRSIARERGLPMSPATSVHTDHAAPSPRATLGV